MSKIDIEKLSLEVMRSLEEYKNMTLEVVEKAVNETAKETVKELKYTSPVGESGDYSKSWKYKRDKDAKGRNKYNMIVYSKSPDYRLTHLLEHGHAIVSGGRTVGKAKAYPHIKDAEFHAETRLLNKMQNGIKEISI